ncbi:MAG: hypothetical protein AWU57_3846 [Marinobacter sp. T13-3]|nr:MAG: hypothetical protein AWU57_3846 [Marinobacter sp. T13-3]
MPAFGFTLDSWRYRKRAGETNRDELGHAVEDFEMSHKRDLSQRVSDLNKSRR